MSVTLTSLLAALEKLAPLALAESWDNVGLLLDPRPAHAELSVERVLLTIDATDAVIRETSELGAQCLVAYHPPLFRPEKRWSRALTPVAFAAAERGFAVYSPHSALDAAAGGLNDWLAAGLGSGRIRALEPASNARADAELKLVVFVPEAHADRLRAALSAAGAGVIGAYTQCSFAVAGEGTFYGDASSTPAVGAKGQLERVRELRLEMVCSRRAAPALVDALEQHHPYEEPAWELYPLAPKPLATAGAGRLLTLDEPASLGELVERTKHHLGLDRVRLATSAAHANGARVARVAVCAGSGKGVFSRATDADLYVTGELDHHSVLALLARGKSLILCDHTHTERGYLPHLRERLLALEPGLDVVVSAADREPLVIV